MVCLFKHHYLFYFQLMFCIFIYIFTSYRYIELRLEVLIKFIKDKVLLVEFLMQRSNAKQILIQVLQQFMTELPVSLMDIPAIFDKINPVYRNYLEKEIQNQVNEL